MGFVVRQLTPDLWPALEDLFGTTGPVGRCWCMYWRLGNKYRDKQPDENRDAFHEVVEQGPPPGLVAFDEDLAVGWCQLTPVMPSLARSDVAPQASGRRSGVVDLLFLHTHRLPEEGCDGCVDRRGAGSRRKRRAPASRPIPSTPT